MPESRSCHRYTRGVRQDIVSSQAIASIDASSQELLKNEDKLTLLLFGQGDFMPTANMCRLVIDYIRQDEDLSPMRLLVEQGHSRQNWYLWQNEYPGFLKWWNRVIEDVIKEEYLSGMYLQLLKRARTHDTGAAKLIAQRYDPKYTERSQQDQRVSFQGYDPPAAEDSRERQRKALAKRGQSLPGDQPDAREQGLLPNEGDNHTCATARADSPDTKLITGVAPVYPGITPAIQAQSLSEEHVSAMDAALSDDNTLDFEPIPKVDPPGGGFEE